MKVFVYGTLLKGMSRAHVLEYALFLGHASIPGQLYDLGAYPAVRDAEGEGVVYGELYEVNETTLNRLDAIEGYDVANEKHSLFIRKQVLVTCLHDAVEHTADTYLYASLIDTSCRIACGDYRHYLIDKGGNRPQWYIAYGSNMSTKRLSEREVEFVDIQRGELAGYQLIFNKEGIRNDVKANLRYVGNDVACPFVAYALKSGQIDKLDRCERIPCHYVRLGMPFTTQEGETFLGYIYLAHPEKLTDEKIPAEDYLQHIIHGYEEHGFDIHTLPRHNANA